MSKQQQRMMEEQQNHRLHEQMQGSMWREQKDMKAEYLSELTSTSLSQGTIDVLDNYISPDWILANIDSSEYNELRWLSRLVLRKVFAMHPGHESTIQGKHRAFAFNDEDDYLEALTEQEEVILETFIEGYIKRASRAKSGWQQDKMGETIAVSEVRNEKSNEDGFLSGLFS